MSDRLRQELQILRAYSQNVGQLRAGLNQGVEAYVQQVATPLIREATRDAMRLDSTVNQKLAGIMALPLPQMPSSSISGEYPGREGEAHSPTLQAAEARIEALRADPVSQWDELENVWRSYLAHEALLGSTENAALGKTYKRYFDENGILLSNESSTTTRAAYPSVSNRIQSRLDSSIGREVRYEINRGYIAYRAAPTLERSEMALGGISLVLGADQAYAEGKVESGSSLLGSGAQAIDLSLGLTPIPLVSSANDLVQIVHGMATGYDYTGHRMEVSDYALRGVGIVLGVCGGECAAAGKGVLRIGGRIIERGFEAGASIIRSSGQGLQAARVFSGIKDRIPGFVTRIGQSLNAFANRAVVSRSPWVRELPELVDDHYRAFDGAIFKGLMHEGEIMFQAQRPGQVRPGRWFTPVRPLDPVHAEEMLNIRKWENSGEQVRAYKFKTDVSVYAGKVEGGIGHQVYVPEDVLLEQILEEVKF